MSQLYDKKVEIMVKFLSLLFFFISSIIAIEHNAYSIVFIHLGDQLPNYLYDAAIQARLFNPIAKIIILAEQKALARIDQQCVQQHNLVCITCESLKRTPEHTRFLRDANLNPSFREGFWIKSTERFFYLDELATTYNLRDVFHMEYDNMLYVNLTEFLPIFHQHYPHIGATFDNDDRCIAGLIYFAHPQAVSSLVSYIAKMAASGRNDMEVLALYRKNQPKDAIINLPIIMGSYLEKHPLKSRTGKRANNPQDYIVHEEHFKSIFDAAALGQFLGGIDPRNGDSMPGFINESCLFNPSP